MDDGTPGGGGGSDADRGTDVDGDAEPGIESTGRGSVDDGRDPTDGPAELPPSEADADAAADADADDDAAVVGETTELRPLTLDEALSILGEETRARIVAELGDAWNADPPGATYLSFSELMDRVGAEDSGRFNYHLDKLVGTFVAKSEEGYAVKQPGKHVHEAIVAGTFTDRDRIEGVPVDDCPTCEEHLTATYRSDQILVIACEECERAWSAVYVPPRAFEGRSTDAVLDVAGQLAYHDIGLFRRGVCHGCGGRVTRDLAASVPDIWPDEFDFDVFATLACTECKESTIGHPATVGLTTPTVISFFHDHDRDPMLVRGWSEVVRSARAATTVASEDPMRVAVPYDLDDERLRVTLDADLQVVGTDRSPL